MSKPVTLLVISNPTARYLRRLAELPDSTHIVAGERIEAFAHVVEKATVVLNCVLANDVLQWVLARAPKLEWIHSFSAGVDNLLFPALVSSPIPFTNARGVFAESLGEFALSAMLFFAKDHRRMLRNQAAAKWEQFDVEMLYGKTLGIAGYGSIGGACARRARAMGMRVVALERPEGSAAGDPQPDAWFARERLAEMLAQSDFVIACAPLTPQTRGLIGEAELGAMKPSAVILNLGRGPVIVESALVAALARRRIRGAALDVFDIEPLPAGHPFWQLDNVLLSPHCADHTATWLDDAMALFLRNFERFRNGLALENLVDKPAGY